MSDDNPIALLIDNALPLYNVGTLAQSLTESIAPRRFNLLMLTMFATVAVVLAVIGVYGVMAYTVAQRTHEIGVRMTLGARATDVVRMIFVDGAKITCIGIAAGLLAALALSRTMESLLFGVEPTDPTTLILVGTTFMATALAACLLSAARAARIDPLVALRHE